MFTVRPLRLSRVAYRTVVVYSLLVLTTVWLLQDMLFGTKLDLTNPDDAKLLTTLAHTLEAPLRNHFCRTRPTNAQRRQRYATMFDHFYIEEEEDADHQEDENTANDMSNAAAKDAPTDKTSNTRTVPSEDDWRPPSPFDQWVNGTRPVVEQQPHLEGLQLEDTLDFHPNLDRLHSQRFLIAINLHNNQEVIPDFMMQLREVLFTIGWRNVFVSIYESGSADQTKNYLRFMEILLGTWQIPYRIRMSGDRLTPLKHRIEYLAGVRNEALYPLNDPVEFGHFQKVLFINDIFFCADDLRELIYQSYRHHADVTCATDFDVAEPSNDPQLGFYDTWVARDVRGEAFTKRPADDFVKDPFSALRLHAGLPFQVSCCWNGAVVLNAAPFYPPHNVRFRRETTHILDEPGIQQSTSTAVRHAHQLHPEMPVYERCSSSEINLLCKDFHLAGYDRSIVVPRVRVAYDWKMYAHMRRAFENPREGAPVTVLPRTTMEEYDAREDEPLEWRPYPETVECKPLDRRASRGPTGAWGYEVYTRPGDVEAMYAPSAII